jgi:CRISPR-associated protein Cmr5
MRRNLEQKRAEYALKTIKKRKEELQKDVEKRERYLNRVKSLPATIIMCGLGQSLATLLSVGKGKHDSPDQMLYEDLQDWLCNSEHGAVYKEKDLINEIVKNSRKNYIQAQAEVLKLMEWIKKFATAYLSNEVKSHDASAV